MTQLHQDVEHLKVKVQQQEQDIKVHENKARQYIQSRQCLNTLDH